MALNAHEPQAFTTYGWIACVWVLIVSFQVSTNRRVTSSEETSHCSLGQKSRDDTSLILTSPRYSTASIFHPSTRSRRSSPVADLMEPALLRT